MKIPTICRYCGGKVVCTDSSAIYGKSYGYIYLCLSCNAYTGVHKNSNKPLGTLANRVLRLMRKDAHTVFDRYWKEHNMSRSDGYKWLSKQLGISKNATHIGLFEIEMCQKVIDICSVQN